MISASLRNCTVCEFGTSGCGCVRVSSPCPPFAGPRPVAAGLGGTACCEVAAEQKSRTSEVEKRTRWQLFITASKTVPCSRRRTAQRHAPPLLQTRSAKSRFKRHDIDTLPILSDYPEGNTDQSTR